MLEELNRIKYKIETIKSILVNCENKIQEDNKGLQECEEMLSKILVAKQFYKKGVDIIYERSVQELKDTLNSALSYVFFDEDYTVDIILSDKRGKSLSLIVMQNGYPISLKRGMAMGVNCVISAILHIYYLQCKNSNILILDEAYHNVSRQYVERFFEFLRRLTLSIGFTLVLITHDERVTSFANRVYKINHGKIKVEDRSDG